MWDVDVGVVPPLVGMRQTQVLRTITQRKKIMRFSTPKVSVASRVSYLELIKRYTQWVLNQCQPRLWEAQVQIAPLL